MWNKYSSIKIKRVIDLTRQTKLVNMKRITPAVFILFAFSSCSHYYYIPAAQNIPLFKEKNEFRGSVATGGGDETSTVDIQAAYSITNKFAVMSNFVTAKGNNKDNNLYESPGNLGNGTYLDAAFGYFKPLGSKGVFEIYGGIGGSNQHHQYESTTYDDFGGYTTSNRGSADLSFTKIYLQPSIGFTSNGFDMAFSSSICKVNFNKIDNRIDSVYIEHFAVDKISQNKNSFLFEPSLTVRGGWKYAKLQLQYVFSKNLSHPDLSFEKGKFSIGLTVSFAQRFRKKIAINTTQQ